MRIMNDSIPQASTGDEAMACSSWYPEWMTVSRQSEESDSAFRVEFRRDNRGEGAGDYEAS